MADKGNITVAINRNEYINKINPMLSDKDTYLTIDHNPIQKIEKQLKDILNRWHNKGFIDKHIKFQLNSSDGLLPRAYGIPKIHKESCLYRIIVSTINGPLHNFAVYLHKLIFKGIPNSPFFVRNSFQLNNVVDGMNWNSDYLLCSLDAVSLFTNVPVELVIESISARWKFICLHTKISKEEFVLAIQITLTSTYFTFNDKVYKQTFGTLMGSPISPIIADIGLQDLELKALNTLKFNIPIYFRYVDDIVMSLPKDQIDLVVSTFNSFHQRLQFTCELQKDNALSFLDIKIIIDENKLI
ncbi:uncharacterized protein LOC109863413, partial [Pseudomyrmex gracilis]|uniref:uncharacterized protein LOC109863413 n=1 Tax=Pseudomyrmex gracilis TaxID=219809 RepID=UPI00099562C7